VRSLAFRSASVALLLLVLGEACGPELLDVALDALSGGLARPYETARIALTDPHGRGDFFKVEAGALMNNWVEIHHKPADDDYARPIVKITDDSDIHSDGVRLELEPTGITLTIKVTGGRPAVVSVDNARIKILYSTQPLRIDNGLVVEHRAPTSDTAWLRWVVRLLVLTVAVVLWRSARSASGREAVDR
jgi:hypothetical protein